MKSENEAARWRDSADLSRRAFRAGQLFLVIMAALGVLLRYALVAPMAGFDYGHFLHAHSHLGFLGWVFNAFLGLALNSFVPRREWPRFRNVFVVAQIGVLGMLIAYPIQGYGPVSITFSALHMVCAIIVAWRLWRCSEIKPLARSYLGWALGFMVVSGFGPLALGPLAATGLRDSPAYLLAIYFYLHFQYNGWFMFFLLALFQQQKERGSGEERVGLDRWALSCLAAGTVLTLAQSGLWLSPPSWVFGLAGVGGLLQLLGLGFLLRAGRGRSSKRRGVSGGLFRIAVAAFALKLGLQFLMAWPSWGGVANNRFTVIAFLHLVFLLIVTPTILGWALRFGWCEPTRRMKVGLAGLMGGAFLTELWLMIMAMGWAIDPVWALKLLLGTAVVMCMGTILVIGPTKSPSS